MSAHPTTATHPLVRAYLTDLDRALVGVDPRERADVIDGVREHLREALGVGLSADPARVHEVLADLGPVEAIAAQATTSPMPSESTGRDITSLVALLAAIAAAALIFIPFISIPLAIAALVTSAVHLRNPRANRGRSWVGLWVAIATLVITAALAALLLPVSTETVISTPIEVTSAPAG